MEYRIDDKMLNASVFPSFVNQVWPGDYDVEKTQNALSKTLNITAFDGDKLVGCLRILSDGYFFGTITELLILPEYQKQGIGSRLLQLAKENTPTMLYFGSQPGIEAPVPYRRWIAWPFGLPLSVHRRAWYPAYSPCRSHGLCVYREGLRLMFCVSHGRKNLLPLSDRLPEFSGSGLRQLRDVLPVSLPGQRPAHC